MVKSLQDILKQRQQEDFVGREEQLTFFEENIRRSPDDPRRRFIIGVSGQGGVGKTWLLRRFRQIAEAQGAISAWTDELQRNLPEVMGCIAEQFDAQGHPLKAFAERYRVYRQRKQEIEADPEAPKGFPVFLGRTLAKGGLRLARRVPVGGVVADFVDEEAFASLAGDFASYVARKIGNKDEVRLVLEPVEVLTPLFLSGLGDIAGKQTVTLFCDTYEHTGSFLDPWLRDLLDGRYGEVPANILLVIAGRNELDRNLWASYKGLLARLPLEPFTEEEAREYLTRKGITDARVVEVILSLSQRMPAWVSTLASEAPDDPSKVGDPSGEAVERFLKWVEDPRRRQVALDAALPRRLNRDVLAVLAGEEEADALFEWLRQMPFLERRGDCWAYHEVVRTQMLRHKRQVSPQGWADLHGRLAACYEGLRESLGLGEGAAHRDEAWQTYTLEMTYHRLCQAAHKHLPAALNRFVTVLDASVNYARSLAQTIRQAGVDGHADPLRDWGERLLQGLDAYRSDDHPQALAFLSALLDEPGLEANQRALVLARRGETYRLMEKYDEALADLNRAVELRPDLAWAIALRGETYRLMGKYDEALADFNRAIELQPDYARAIAHRGETYRQMGKY
ncbi:MAG: tetratricopeptide repeat protein, partial [Anaerolineae bacterium]|nr:tetratricopeptide repeat protein [Anaerolineae bacterium]